MKKLILTQCVGTDFEPIKELVYPNFKAYARRVGADFHSIEDQQQEVIVYDKLRIADMFSDYDRAIWLDADILVRPDCPDLFKLVPEDEFAGYEERLACKTEDERSGRILTAIALGDFYGLPRPIVAKEWVDDEGEVHLPYVNAGVLVASRQHEEIFRVDADLSEPPEDLICPEQGLINYRMWHVKPTLYHLPVCFNQMPWNWTPNYLRCSYIVHFAGFKMEARMRRMGEALKFWGEKYR